VKYLYFIALIIFDGMAGCNTAPHEKPNIIFIFADDQSFETVNAFGHEDILTPNLDKLAPFPRTPYAVKVHRQEYYALVSYMDYQIGRIMEALEMSGESDNTYIFFTADHGLGVGHHGLLGKQNMYEHSVRVPLMVSGKGIPENKRLDMPVYLQDIMPSTLELAGIEIPDHVEFNSLFPLIEGKESVQYDAIYGAYMDMQRMVIKDGYKLILYPRVPVARLYNLKDDPDEMQDLATDPSSRHILEGLFSTLLGLQKETGDTLDIKGLYDN